MSHSDIEPGAKFGKLAVIEYTGKDKHYQRLYLCVCECGEERTVTAANLRNAKVRQCKACGAKAHLGNHVKLALGSGKSKIKYADTPGIGFPSQHEYELLKELAELEA